VPYRADLRAGQLLQALSIVRQQVKVDTSGITLPFAPHAMIGRNRDLSLATRWNGEAGRSLPCQPAPSSGMLSGPSYSLHTTAKCKSC
jgi:hypothetical protein